MIYDVTTLSITVGNVPAALEAIGRVVTAADAPKLHACWNCEIGAVGDVMLIRSFATPALLQQARERMALEGNPFGLGDMLDGMASHSYVLFPFLEGFATGKLGPFYEVRIYQTARGGIAPTIELWREAVPHRTKISPLVAALYATDSALPRIMHIWPFPSLDARQAIRQQAFDSGHWPPKGGLVHLRRFSSSIYVPAPFSPLS